MICDRPRLCEDGGADASPRFRPNAGCRCERGLAREHRQSKPCDRSAATFVLVSLRVAPKVWAEFQIPVGPQVHLVGTPLVHVLRLREIDDLVPTLPDYSLFQDLPGPGPHLAPRLLGAFGEDR